MSKTSFWWKSFCYGIEDLLDAILQQRVWQLLDGITPPSRHQLRKISNWLIFLFAIILMWLWNWKLLLATSIGIGVMFFVYLLPSRQWHTYWLKWQKFVKGSNRRLFLSVSGGGMAAFSSYMAASIWAESENRWLATAMIWQCFGTLATLGLLFWNFNRDRLDRNQNKFEQILSDLTDRDSLKRLIAVRKLTRLVSQNKLENEYRYQVIESFRLMLSQEQEAIVREAILDSLQVWDVRELNLQQSQSVPLSLTLKSSKEEIYS